MKIQLDVRSNGIHQMMLADFHLNLHPSQLSMVIDWLREKEIEAKALDVKDA